MKKCWQNGCERPALGSGDACSAHWRPTPRWTRVPDLGPIGNGILVHASGHGEEAKK